MTERKKLSDILSGAGDRDKLKASWASTEAAAEFSPLPRGEYTFRILSGELFTSRRRGTPGYKLVLEVTEGDFQGRRAWCDFWLTPAALPMTKRDLAKLGITTPEQMERPLPQGILIKGKLALRTDDDGNENNRLVRFECIGVEPSDPFAPKDPVDSETQAPSGVDQSDSDGELFPHGANEPDRNGDAAFLAAERGGRTR